MTTTGSVPTPDPTERTITQLLEALKAERDYVDGQLAVRDERLDGIDTATKLRLDALSEVRLALNAGLLHERELTEEKFTSVSQQFVERDTRSEREARDNKVAVDAAFAAQKEAAQKQDEANQKAIDKSETAMDEKVNKLEQLFKTTTDALADKIDDVKVRANETNLQVGGLIQNGAGQQQQKTEERAVTSGQLVAVGLAIAAISIIVNLVIYFAGSTP
jgi:hypothetical protein